MEILLDTLKLNWNSIFQNLNLPTNPPTQSAVFNEHKSHTMQHLVTKLIA